ncbi:hypothetical protein P4571_08545 [Niallia alba]|uniref:hypothetical protein n=1 Tax=Niallia alba TaxID=2729105 RepID=UPI002E224E06|nr:hypothetical protein [Niallia alba]
MAIDFYKSLNLKWYQELIMILAAFLTNGFTVQVAILQNELLKSTWKYASSILWTIGLYIILVLVFVSLRELASKKITIK